MSVLGKILLYAAAAVYPILIFLFLVVFHVSPRLISLVIVFFAAVYFFTFTSKKKYGWRSFVSAGMLLAVGVAGFITNTALFLKFYPVGINCILLGVFSATLFSPPSMIFRFAIIQDKKISGSLGESRIAAYCRKVTLVWCVFFLLNGGTALYTAMFASDKIWSVYNGGISYALIGLLFLGEMIIRKMTDKKIPKAIPISSFAAESRPLETILCYEGTFASGKYKTWKDFLAETKTLRNCIQNKEGNPQKWILHCDDYWYFLVAFVSLLQCGKQVLLTATISPDYIAEIREPGTAFLTDQVFPDTMHVPSLLVNVSFTEEAKLFPKINPEETKILMYTSGSTGKPKAVAQRLKEFESDNAFVLSRWREEFLQRKICSTVNQHHIYGLLFSILLPFTAAIPFRRRRIEYAEEFETLHDDSYMIITVPAFLKRCVEIEAPGNLALKSPWIFTSGGVLPPDIAEKTSELFGFWPMEVYGSTETSGIAYRQSKNGLAWTPFDNAQINLNAEGCIVVHSPYIRDPEGFTTGDLAELLEDGSFILKGRADSIVKIEEKRISLLEVESRILQTELVSDVTVVAMEDKRQYLAAALVLNDAGKKQFKNMETYLVNRWFREYLSRFFEGVVLPKKWRYLSALPMDAQGKKKKNEIQALFSPIESDNLHATNVHGVYVKQVLKQSSHAVKLELFVSRFSDYFDGHFPGFKILPAVAQVEIVVRFASQYFGTGLFISSAKRIKYSNFIVPESTVCLQLDYNPESLMLKFMMSDTENKNIYSSGSLKMHTISQDASI
jgi:uncharacterized membrane protein/acyl-CoA synthetase (AMP-forming)/AMP-acid ligase II/3-hydroxymyristoyl/3-hydroxydecanoyl-(acyl carrier protein) dehydratase